MTDKKDKNQETDIKDEKLEKRRKALKNILAGSGTVVTAAAMQDKWAKPVIESVILPSHAQTSGLNGSFTVSNNTLNETDLLDVLVPSASAACPYALCINVTNGFAEVQVDDNGTVSTGNGELPFDITLQPSGTSITGKYDGTNVTGEFSGGTCVPATYEAVPSSADCNLSGAPTTVAPPTTNTTTTTTTTTTTAAPTTIPPTTPFFN